MFHKYLVPGLDVLIGNPSFLAPGPETRPKARRLLIPESYLYRIDDFHNEMSTRGEAAKELQTIFSEEILRRIHNEGLPYYTFKNGMQLEIVPDEKCKFTGRLNPKSSKSQAVATALSCLDSSSRNREEMNDDPPIDASNLAVMTGSDSLAILAYLHGIDVAMINPEVYTGRRAVELPYELSHLWFTNHRISPLEWKECFPNEAPLHPNEYIVFTGDYHETRNKSYKNIGRCDPESGALVPLRFTSISTENFPTKIWPKSAGQAMAIDALMAPVEEIPIVLISGIFGTGKTFLSVASGYYQINSGDYERIFICPRDGTLGADIGFLPGDATNKTRAKAKPIEDNFLQVLKLQYSGEKRAEKGNTGLGSAHDQFEKLIASHVIEFEPLINMGGRSIADSFIIYDEFQDRERYQAKALLTRPHDTSKMVILGDPTQTTNPHLNATSNGLSYSASKLAGKPEAAVITLLPEEITRSRAAIAIAKYFT